MKTSSKQLAIEQLDEKFRRLRSIRRIPFPEQGWLRSVRLALGMSLKQLGARLGITPQSAREIEERERSGSITLRSLREAAAAMELDLVYALIPRDGSLEELIERRAEALAQAIVMRAAASMELEDQGISSRRLKHAIEEKKDELLVTLPRQLWD